MAVYFGAVIWRPLEINSDLHYELPLVLPNIDLKVVTGDTLDRLRTLLHRPELRFSRTTTCLRHVHSPCIRDFRCSGTTIETSAWLFADVAHQIFGVNVDILYYPDPTHTPEAFIRDIFECKAAA